MGPQESEVKIQQMTDALTDAGGNLLPLDRIEFQVIGCQIRWTVWGRASVEAPCQRLQSLTTRVEDVDGLLEASKLLMLMAVDDATKVAQVNKTRTEEN